MTDRRYSWSADALGALANAAGVRALHSADALGAASEDFGHLRRGTPAAVALPTDAAQVAAVLAFASERRLRVTLRGAGRSQGGQSLAPPGGLALDLSGLAAVDDPDLQAGSIACEAGATWAAVVARTGPAGLLPRVLPANLDLTVGGVLSVGGLGATSHRFGPATAQVLELEAVTGDGRSLAAVRGDDGRLLDAALAGLGRCAAITRVRIALRRFRPRVRTYYLLYDDLGAFLEDQRALQTSGRADYLEGFCSASAQGLRSTPAGRRPFAFWLYALQVSVEHEGGDDPRPDPARVLEGLRPWRLVHAEDADTLAFASRHEARFESMRRSGAWEAAHPWLEGFLPLDAAASVLPRLLEALPLHLGDGHRVMMLEDRAAPPLLALPAQRPVVAFAILPGGVSDDQREAALAALDQAHQALVEAGAKRYLSGFVPTMDDESWAEHLGPAYPSWHAAKHAFDPQDVLRSVLFPGGEP